MSTHRRQLLQKTVHITLWSVVAALLVGGFSAGFEARNLMTPAPLIVDRVSPISDARARAICLHHNGYGAILWVPQSLQRYVIACNDSTSYTNDGKVVDAR